MRKKKKKQAELPQDVKSVARRLGCDEDKQGLRRSLGRSRGPQIVRQVDADAHHRTRVRTNW